MNLFKKLLAGTPAQPDRQTAGTSDQGDKTEQDIDPLERAKAHMSASLTALTSVTYPDRDDIYDRLMQGDIAQAWQRIPDGHKWLGYFPTYERVFAEYRGKTLRILEIGVNLGGSLRLWKDYFGPETTIVGIDITPSCATFENSDERIFVRIGDQSDPAFLASVVEEFGPFDIVIDDGSHVVSHQIASFNALFHQGVAAGGLYLVEDLETSYWGDRTGQRDIDIGFHDFVAAIVDEMHRVYRTRLYPDFVLASVAGQTVEVPLIATIVQEVRLFESIAVFYRNDVLPPMAQNLTPGRI